MRFRKGIPEVHFVLTLIVSLILLTTHTRGDFWSGLLIHVIGVPVKAVSFVVHGYMNVKEEFMEDRKRETRLKILTRENSELKNQVNQLALQLNTVRAGMELETISGSLGDAVNARVVSAGPMILVDKGVTSDVRRLDVVISAQGLVGKITRSSLFMSRVLPITNPLAGVSVSAIRTGEHGVVRGLGNGFLILHYLPSTSQVRLDDLLVTDGRDRVFPPGISVGRIVSLQRDEFTLTATVAPAVHYPSLEMLLIVKGKLHSVP